ncbi:Gldg family protein [Pedobacter panaciterrae]|jgi:ABC-type transport system involved in multi-copper enzyme maturation, permease component|uniref:Gldg family protein n=1 Tax=Pedobacter panaciterrae TaxID=363849 RepID=UPI00155D9305|nr:Gldg family protein [Pedobacter panaciterrae]NQX53636.1 Gldg family protein [Pedobacter panaciterrae]
MKTIFRVAKTELKLLFYSPIAWFLIIIFMIQCGFVYLKGLDDVALTVDGGYKIPFSIIASIFSGGRGVLSNVMGNLYLYLPLLTMGLISRETSSGTIRLLYSSPIRVRDIVLGKFAAMVVMSMLMIGIVSIYIIASYFTVSNPDTGLLLSCVLGLFLLLCAYSAIGIFMSCLTTYQIVAAVCTFVTFGILYNVSGLWSGVPFVRDVTYFLSVAGRTDWMLAGLITSNGIVYFLAIVFMFLQLTIFKLKTGMETMSTLKKAMGYSMIVLITLAIGYISSIPQLIVYFDVTRDKNNTIKPDTQKIVEDLGDEPLEVTGYANLFGGFMEDAKPESYQLNINRWAPYVRFKHNIRLKTVLYYDTLGVGEGMKKANPGKTLAEVAAKSAKTAEISLSQFKRPEEIRKMVDLSQEPNYYIMQLKYKGRQTFLRVFPDNDHWPSETEISAALKRLLLAKIPKILFVTGNLERNINKMGDREYRALANLKNFRNSLINQGFDVDTISLQSESIPKNTSALVLADPKTELDDVETAKLQQFIDNGGNLLISGEPGKQAMLNPLLKQFGVQLMAGAIVQASRDLEPHLAAPFLTGTGAKLYPPLVAAHYDSVVVSMPMATALGIENSSGYIIKPLLVTDERRSWLKKDKFVTDSAKVKFEPERGDLQKSFPLAVSLARNTKGKEQRIVVVGDADFMSNIELNRFNMRTANFAFNTGIFSWLSYGEFPISSYRPSAKDTTLLIKRDQIKYLRIAFLWVFPGMMVAIGTLILIRRKRK